MTCECKSEFLVLLVFIFCLFKNNDVVDRGMYLLQIVGEYMLYRDEQPYAEALHTVSCRLLLDIMPGLETSVIFQDNVCYVMFISSDIDTVNCKRLLNMTVSVFFHAFIL